MENEKHLNISVVVPLYNEEESLPELYSWIVRVMESHGFTFEVIFVNDGSTDHSWNVIENLSANDSRIHAIKFRRNYGNPQPFIVVSAWRRAMSSSLWMQTCKILQTRFQNFTG